MLITATGKASTQGVTRKTAAVVFESFSGAKIGNIREACNASSEKKLFHTIFLYHATFYSKVASIKHGRRMMKQSL
jgi:hypothetical protein